MGVHLLSYNVATGGSVTDKDTTAVTDPEISQRNGHYIFTEDYKLIAAYASGANITRVAYSVPTWNAIGKYHLWPVNASADIPSPPAMAWYDEAMPLIPKNEEFQVLVTDSAAETPDIFLWLASKSWTANLPQGRLPMPVRFTATITIVAHAWSALGAITFEQSLRGGVYSVIGCQAQGTHMTAFRLVFPRNRMESGRRLRAGALAINAIGDKMDPQIAINPAIFGEWGRFHTFESPQMEINGNTAGSTSIEGRMWLVYLGESLSILDQWVATGT